MLASRNTATCAPLSKQVARAKSTCPKLPLRGASNSKKGGHPLMHLVLTVAHLASVDGSKRQNPSHKTPASDFQEWTVWKAGAGFTNRATGAWGTWSLRMGRSPKNLLKSAEPRIVSSPDPFTNLIHLAVGESGPPAPSDSLSPLDPSAHLQILGPSQVTPDLQHCAMKHPTTESQSGLPQDKATRG